MTGIRTLLEAMRPLQWSKNLVVFAGLIFAGKAHSVEPLLVTIGAFVVFCLLSSSVYLINDTADADRDRIHPIKKKRPVASGRLHPSQAISPAIILAIAGTSGAFALNFHFGLIGAGYWLLMLVYTLLVKHEVILDVFFIAAGFVLRALGGAVAIDVHISPWLIVCTTLLALFLALSKRRAELNQLEEGESHRRTLEHYNQEFIDQMISIVTAATVVAYMLYAIQSDTAVHHNALILTVPFVLYGIFRYLYLVYRRDLGDTPERMILQDRPLLITIILWGGLSALVLWRF